MNNIEQYKAHLESDLQTITQDLQELGIKNPNVQNDWIATPQQDIDTEPDTNIAADRSEDWQEQRATLSLLETRYNNIVRALQKITDNAYGLCEICDGIIEEDRLAINPAARTCTKHLSQEDTLSR